MTERVWTADADMPWNQPKVRRKREPKPAPAVIPPVQKKPAQAVPPVQKKPAPAVPLYVKKADRGPLPGRWQELAPKFSAALAVDFRYAEAFAKEFHRLQDPTARQTRLPRV